MNEDYEDYCNRVEAEARAETDRNNPVRQSIRYVYFTSKSKGRGRKRKHWVEVELVSYRGGPFKLWHKFPFDVCATECFGDSIKADEATEEFKEQIRAL